MSASVGEVVQVLVALPDRHVDDDCVIAEELSAGQVTEPRLLPPDKSWRVLSKLVDHGKSSDKLLLLRRAKRSPKAPDVDLGELVSGCLHQIYPARGAVRADQKRTVCHAFTVATATLHA